MPTVYTAPRVTISDAPLRLRKFEASFRNRWMILMALGLIVCFIGPAIFAGVLLAVRMLHPEETQHSYLYFFGVCSLVMVPIGLLLGRFVQGNLTDRAAEGVGTLYGARAYHVPAYGTGRVMVGVIFIDICLWGPRMVFAGMSRILGLGKHAKADRAVAGKILAILLTYPEGIGLSQLMTQTAARTANEFSDALAILAYLDIIDIAKDGTRAWLQSLAREKLGG